ncbi:unnamed protein product, partial [Leptidea sinapis]
MAELLVVPFKKSSDVDIVKPLKNLIQSTYNEGAEDIGDAITELSRLRTNAIWKVFEKSSLDDLYSYYDQLVSLESKIPPQEVQIPFKWKDAFDRGSIFGGRMSLSNVMLAVHQETTPDLNPETLNTISQLMLAQAQEVIAYKCMRDEMKESMVAKVCAQCEELYTDALRSMQNQLHKHLWERDWIPAVSSKQTLFRGATHYYQAQVCRAGKAVGEEIARLQLAVELLKGSSGGKLLDLATKAARQLAAAVKDNDFIYHERIPDARALEPVARAAVAQVLPPPERWASARDLFAKLMPAPVQQALQASAARKADMVNTEINKLRDATQLLNSGVGLPESIRVKARELREAGGTAALQRLMAELPELLQRNRDILDEFGARWSRTPSDTLTESFRANAAKYAQIIDNAVRADAIVRDKFNTHKEAMKSERDAIESELKDCTVDLRERFLSALAADGALDEPALSAGALGAALGPLQRRAATTLAAQERLAERLRAAHAALLLVAFQNKVSDFCFARKTEKEELLKDLTQEASRAGPPRPAPEPPQQ